MEVFWRLPINRIPPPSPRQPHLTNGDVTHPQLPQTAPSKFCGTRTSGRSCPTITECDPEWRKTKQTAHLLRQVLFAQTFAFLLHKSWGSNFCVFLSLTFSSTFHGASSDRWDQDNSNDWVKSNRNEEMKMNYLRYQSQKNDYVEHIFSPPQCFVKCFFILPSDASTKIPPQRTAIPQRPHCK